MNFTQRPVNTNKKKIGEIETNSLEKIVMIGSLPPIRAISSYCYELVSAVSKIINVEFISFNKIYPEFMYPGRKLKEDHTFPSISIDNITVNRRLSWYNPFSWFIEGFLPKGELLHAQWWSFPLFIIYFVVCTGFKLRGKPVVLTVHNVMPHEKSHAYTAASGILFKLCSHFIVHTNQNKYQLQRNFNIPERRITVIPHGTLDFHVQPRTDREIKKKEFGFDAGNKIILLFGAVRPYKGMDTAIKAFAEVVEKVPESRLLIAGKLWEDWGPYNTLIHDLGLHDYVVTRLNYIPSGDVATYFAASDLVVLPYHHFDSQSGVGTTAISFRKPLIVTNSGGLPDLVNDRRYIVPPKNSPALSSAILSCINNPEQLKAMSESAETVAEKLSWTVIANKTISVYTEVLGISSDLERNDTKWAT